MTESPPRHFRRPPSGMDAESFIATYGGVYEDSPHFALKVWPQAQSGTLDTVAGLTQALRAAVESSGQHAQLALIRAHPDLADRLRAAPLTKASAAEQAGAGLDHCSAEELAEFRRLNTAYREKFGIPFIKAVRGFSRWQILEEFRTRLANDARTERATALAEIHKIAALRLADLG